MEPVTAVMMVAAAVSAVGAVSSANAQAASYQSTAQAQDYQAERDRDNATVAWQQAGAREDVQRQRARQILSTQRAGLAQSGIDSSTGSAALIQEQSADAAEMDALTIRYQGDLAARGHIAQSNLDRYSADVSRSMVAPTRRAGFLSAAGQLLQGAGGAYGQSARIKYRAGLNNSGEYL